MALAPVNILPSSNIQAVFYDEDSKTLEIVFWRDNRRYRYYDVDSATAAGFTASGLSAGKYFELYVEGAGAYEEIF